MNNLKQIYQAFYDKLYDIYEIVRHHLSIAKNAFLLEKEAGPNRLTGMNNLEKTFLPAVLEITEKPPSPAGRILAVTIMSAFLVAFLWACFGEIDIIATARGKLIPASRAKIIQPLEAGIITEILIEDGQEVKEGQALIKLDPTQTSADITRINEQALTAQIEAARLRALINDDPANNFNPPKEASAQLVHTHLDLLKAEIKDKEAKLDVIRSEIDKAKAQADVSKASITRLDRILPGLKERIDAKKKLVERGISARMPFLELEQELLETQGDRDVEQKRLKETEANIASLYQSLEQTKAEFNKDVSSRLADAEAQISALEQELIKATEKGRLTTITSPVNGVVQQLAVHTIGGVVTPAQQLMVIVPDGHELEVEAMVLNRDIGFVNDGQLAEVKIDSFPFTKYGTIPANLKHVSHDSVQDEQMGLVYPARLIMARNKIKVDDKWINLTAGMAVTVEVKTGKRRVIEYITSPIAKYAHESIRER